MKRGELEKRQEAVTHQMRAAGMQRPRGDTEPDRRAQRDRDRALA